MASTLATLLADRIRELLGDRPGLHEQKMFGGRAFMLHGNMLVGPMKSGSLLVRTGKEGYEQALALPGARPMNFTGRTMSGFVEVDAEAVEADEDLARWIALAERFVLTLPPK